MKTNPTLAENREELRKQMETYRSLPEYVLDGIGALFTRSKLPRNASAQENEGFPSYWINGVLLTVLTVLLGLGISVLLREQLTVDEFLFISWASAMGALSLIANKVNVRAFLNTFYGPLLDRVERSRDLTDLGNWLNRNFRLKFPLFFGLIIGPILGMLLYRGWRTSHGLPPVHIGSVVAVALSCMEAMWVGYYLYPFYLMFPPQLHRYHFDLYSPDPSSSEVVGRLSRLLSFILYVTMGFIIQLMIGLGFFDVLSEKTLVPGFLLTLLVVSPMVIMYAAGQYHLSDLITRSKWKMLNEVQEKIEKLYSGEEIPDKDTLDRLSKLMDYHDRIKSTPNSALNFRASLNFLNSLLLPILAFVFANLDKVLDVVRNFAGNR
jgi:undecaprenyl pyrophosphate phosphatase UppP